MGGFGPFSGVKLAASFREARLNRGFLVVFEQWVVGGSLRNVQRNNIKVFVGLVMTHHPSSMKEGLVLSLEGFCFVRDTLFLNLMFVLRIPFQLLVSLVNFSVAH